MSQQFDIDSLLEEVVTLPSLPGTIAHLVSLVDDPECSLAAVAKAISTDPALAMKTLRLVNSAYYGMRQQIATIEHAVVLLGMKVVKNLAFTATVFDVMKDSDDLFLRHNVTCGVAMRAIVEAKGENVLVESSDEVFIYGLLHDIGKIVIQQFMPGEYAQIAALCQTRNIPWHQAENEVIGVDHAELGARLAQTWKLPDQLVHAIAGHHDIEKCEAPEAKGVAAMLSVADYVCAACGIVPNAGNVVLVSDDAWAASGLTGPDMPAILQAFFDSMPMVEELMQVTM